MNYVGIDIGSTASKVVARGEKELHFVLPTGWSSKETTMTIKERLLTEGIDVLSDETKVAATGYGRIAVDFADYVITEITCHARGGRSLAGTILLSSTWADRIRRLYWWHAAWYRIS